MTTYSAQGSTVDRAFVAADPSIDKQEMYVAMSRSRGETPLYATPEIQIHREEIAPPSPHLREGIPHIAEAAERDRAQLAAHEVALRSRFEGLPTDELVKRHRKLEWTARQEARAVERRQELAARIERAYERPESQRFEWRIVELEAELHEMPVPTDAARREFAVADLVLAERRELAITAARISPPDYIQSELGERPSDPAKQKAWDRGVAQIEGYRQHNGIKDPSRAFGRESKQGAERARQEQALRRLQRVQRDLGLGQFAHRTRALGRSMSIGR